LIVNILVANNTAGVLMWTIAQSTAVQTCPVGRSVDVHLHPVHGLGAHARSVGGLLDAVRVADQHDGQHIGKYTFWDFSKIGVLLQFWQMLFSMIAVIYEPYWYITWPASVLLFLGSWALATGIEKRRFGARSGATQETRPASPAGHSFKSYASSFGFLRPGDKAAAGPSASSPPTQELTSV
jgi:hypothetical protein